MNEFRKKLLGVSGEPASLLRAKTLKDETSRAAEEQGFDGLSIARAASRGAANHRDCDRHRLTSEIVSLYHGKDEQQVALINLSGGGAMIEAVPGLKLWDRIELGFGEGNRIEAAVRWIKNDRIGLEFAHETRIDASEEEVNDLLRSVLRRSFADLAPAVDAAVEIEADVKAFDEAVTGDDDQHEREVRHPLIWSGAVHFNHDSAVVRLRNISANGALLDCQTSYPVGSELLLDLDEAGSIFATVHWAQGDQVGLKFHQPYDLSKLAAARPNVTSHRWTAPDHLREDRSTNSPWAAQWNRSDIAGLQRRLDMTQSAIRRR